MDRRMVAEVRKLNAEANRISDALYLAFEGKPEREAMTEAVSEEHERISAEPHPVIRADYWVRALRGIAADFGVSV